MEGAIPSWDVSHVDQLIGVNIIPTRANSLIRAQEFTTKKCFQLNLSLILGTRMKWKDTVECGKTEN